MKLPRNFSGYTFDETPDVPDVPMTERQEPDYFRFAAGTARAQRREILKQRKDLQDKVPTNE